MRDYFKRDPSCDFNQDDDYKKIRMKTMIIVYPICIAPFFKQLFFERRFSIMFAGKTDTSIQYK